MGACDPENTGDLEPRALQDADANVDVTAIEIEDAAETLVLALEDNDDQAMQSCEESQSVTIEVFHFQFSDIFAINLVPTGLFPPRPDDIDTFIEPELEDGFIAAFKAFDLQGNLIGFGTEQEVLDFANAETATTFTLTLPERGTLMFGEQEDIAPLLDEVNDMDASQDYVRTYDPPRVDVSTIPGTGRIIGGTGEFENITGSAIEIGVTHSIDLIEREFDLEVYMVLAYTTN
ncbi:hypothetical protein G6O69_22135 [Pseudenhygromyxa sp. WMMC2535]|uniref:hypothetical protein n=1 Tax=Pseudenhygromyxa sp. WMMC2535 TaxID=2712867 RepID=UPI001595C67E|nr:hypothetical protein [Pseudenhygromyxa sp. WMMC2535]NVB40557.1 hypothetical protein [Pseudenhygromyxa sp. WMMC2535]